MSDQVLRVELLDTAREMNAIGINQGTSGNVSVRSGDGFLITPSGLPYDESTPDDMVPMTLDADWSGDRKPSSEWRFHLDIYKARDDVQAVVHVHSTFATTIACLGKEIPAFHYMVAVAGGKTIRCAPYHTFGTQELSDVTVDALVDRKACLLANHGMIATGPNLKKALAMAVEVEKLCEMYWRTLQLGGGPVLDDAEMDIILSKFQSYGQFAKKPANQ
ncbi:class II aldolase/adducin family protein [Aestuariispira ectoiniformans]|uniref:class II aldolase/adducin family protein n=1 Tax=Aestuariispira ectoiniformans TaxID=2775080 RepID=UPI00223A843C|nr:class II aldolase/adducin family protein [Aestuariispira ectoiniformans]